VKEKTESRILGVHRRVGSVHFFFLVYSSILHESSIINHHQH
jgi:hypothetical protein